MHAQADHSRVRFTASTAIPAELRALPQWVVWQIRDGKDRPTKVPLNPRTGHAASSTNPATWTDFETAQAAVPRWHGDGIGFVFTRDDPFVGIDLDHCVDPETGRIEPDAQRIIDRIDSYTEVSPTGTGIHIIVCGTLPPGGRKKGDVEMYDVGKYFTMTGWHLKPTITGRSSALAALHAEVFGRPLDPTSALRPPDQPRSGDGVVIPLSPDQRRQYEGATDRALVREARNAENGAKFTRLWEGQWQGEYASQSEADLALISMLAFWTRNRARIDRLFRQSALYRPKWNRADYRDRTIRKALDAPESHSVGDDRPPRPGPRESLALGLGEFLSQTFPRPIPLIESLLTDDGGGWIAGEEKVGKTLYALHEGLCVGTGVPVLGHYRVPERRRVLVIEEEDSPRRTQRRVVALLRGLGFDPDNPALREELDDWFRLSVWQGLNLDHPDWIARLEAEIAEHRPAVVYLDVLRKLTARDLNKAVEATALLQTLDRLRREYGVVFRVLHHHRKIQTARAGRGSQELAGSYVLGAWAENSMFFEPLARRQGPVKVEVQSKDLAPMPAFKLVIESEGPAEAPTHLRLRAEPLGDSDTREQSRQAILDQLRVLPPRPSRSGGQGVTATDIAQALKLHESNVRARLRDLEQRHLARRAGVWTRPAGLGARDVVLWAAEETGV